MADIYLAISETPTVVTLTSAVINSAVASSVTVANTVTVALDANSLSALENVTVTVGAAITGTVTVGNFPATQAVSLASVPTHGVTLTSTTVTVSSLPAISGTVTIGSALPAGTNNIGVVTANFGGNSRMMGTVAPLGSATTGYVSIGVDGSPIGSGAGRVVVDVVNQNGNSFLDNCLVNNNAIRAFGTVTIGAGTAQIGSVTASISGTVPVSGTFWQATQPVSGTFFQATQPVSLTTLPALVAGTAQIGSVTASISGTVPVSGTFFQATQPASLASLPALAAGTNQIGSVTASINGTVPISISSVTLGNSVTIASLPAISGTVTANTFAVQGTAVTTSNFTSTTASTVLASFNATREVLTIFNEGAGNLHVCVGATCTTIAYQVRLSAGDYYEVPNHQTTITHSAVFATAGTARVTEVT